MLLQNNVLVQLDNNPRIKELNNLCSSDNLSLSALQEKLNRLDENDINLVNSCYNTPGSASCFHRVCMNKNITLDIIQCLLNAFPKAVEWPTYTIAYPLHLCCYNIHCKSDVIELLVGLFPKPLDKLCLIEDGITCGIYGDYMEEEQYQTVPLGYYLGRNNSKCINVNTVRVLVEANSNALVITSDDFYQCYPIHIALCNSDYIDNEDTDLYDIVTLCIEAEPCSVEMIDSHERTLLHVIFNECGRSDNANLELIRYVVNKWPDAMECVDRYGYFPLSYLSQNGMMDDSGDILNFLLDVVPASAMEVDESDRLPIHHALSVKSFPFCKILLDAYPESARITIGFGEWEELPIHHVCEYGSGDDDNLDIIRYLLELYPLGINEEARCGWLPIHKAAKNGNVEVIKLLLQYDPKAATKKTTVTEWHSTIDLPFHVACEGYRYDAAKLLYDIYPEAIMLVRTQAVLGEIRRRSMLYADSWGAQVLATVLAIINFGEEQLVYALKARDLNALAVPDENGWFPLHRALIKNASLGSIKLLLQGNPSAVQVSDRKGVYPLHLACEFSSVGVVHCLIGKLDVSMLDHIDGNGDTILHRACRGGNSVVVNYLLKTNASLVSIADSQNRLPIHLFCETDNDERESPEYVETVWCLLLASPEVFKDEES